MSSLKALFIKELMGIFYSPIAYVVGAIFSLINAFSFFVLIQVLSSPWGEISSNIVTLFFGGTFLFWLSVLFVAPIMTMRAISEEKKSGTIELLFTAPITDTQIILAKFFSVMAFYVALWLPSLAFMLYVRLYAPVDFGVLACAYIGVFLLGGLMMSMGLMFSAITQNQIIAAVSTFCALLALFSLGFLAGFVQDGLWKDFLDYTWLIGHFEDFGRGILDLKRVVFYVSLTVFQLFLAIQILGTRRWKA